ncbi:hypothetical protein V7124_19540 [Neobacillus niacini]|uniref:hypothetical protein n=1 Tax=Neobacillus niacini TaxID=86668 RepID=UPI002FFF5F53
MRVIIAKDVEIKVNGIGAVTVDIVRNESGNIEFVGLPSVYYEMLNEEIWFTKAED